MNDQRLVLREAAEWLATWKLEDADERRARWEAMSPAQRDWATQVPRRGGSLQPFRIPMNERCMEVRAGIVLNLSDLVQS